MPALSLTLKIIAVIASAVAVCILLFALVKLRYLKGSNWENITVDGREREYIIKKPSALTTEQKGAPAVIIALHGWGDRPRQIEFYSELSTYVDEYNFVALYPKGTQTQEERKLSWNARICCNPAVAQEVDDVAFLQALIDKAITEHGVDPDGIFMTGFSNGAMMTQHFTTQEPKLLRGAAIVGGAVMGTVNLEENDELIASITPLPVLLIHSQADKTVPFEGGLTKTNDARFSSFELLVSTWERVNKPSSVPTKVVIAKNIGHMWPGWIVQRITQPFTQKVFATREILDFFETQKNERKSLLALGDSYTIGQGVAPEERWPEQLVAKNRDIALEKTIARTGWPTSLLLTASETALESQTYDHISLMIGVNDWVQGVAEADFRRNFRSLLEKSSAALRENGILIVITIPDFALTPSGTRFGDPRKNSAGIDRFNTIILEEAAQFSNIKIIDANRLSKKVLEDQELVARDGLHYSGEWYKLLAQEVSQVLTRE